MAHLRSLTPTLLEAAQMDLLFNEFTRIEEEWPMVLKTVDSTKAYEEKFKVAGLGQFQLKPEGMPIAYDEPVQGPRKRVTHATYGLGYRVTEEMRDDDQFGVVSQMPSELSDSAKDHRETIAWGPFNLAFVTTQFTTMDGLALCSAAHIELKTGATASNLLSPGVGFSHTGLESMLTQIRLTQNEQGRPIKLTPQKILTHPNEEWEVARVTESTQESGTNENQINTMKTSRTGLSSMQPRYFEDEENWFIVSAEHDITWHNRKDLTPDSSMDAHTKDQLFDARYRASVASWDWRGVNGSQP